MESICVSNKEWTTINKKYFIGLRIMDSAQRREKRRNNQNNNIPVDILDGVNGLGNNLGIDVRRERELDKNAVESRVSVEFLDGGEEILKGSGVGHVVFGVLDASLLAGLLLHGDIDVRVLLLSELDDGEAGLERGVFCLERCDLVLDVLYDRSSEERKEEKKKRVLLL